MNTNSAQEDRCTILKPNAAIVSRWEGALSARLNGAPLEKFLRHHSQYCLRNAQNPRMAGIELACLFIIDPVLPHRIHWRALCHTEYFCAIGRATAAVACGLGDLVQEFTLWRVAALRAAGQLLTPMLGMDMGASVAAASMSVGTLRTGSPPRHVTFDAKLAALAARAVMSGSDGDLSALRSLVGHRLADAMESGAVNISTAPAVVTILAEPPSNH